MLTTRVILLPRTKDSTVLTHSLVTTDYQYPPYRGVFSFVFFNFIIMSNSLKTRVLTNGKSTWRLTRFSDDLFIGKNGFGNTHTFRSVTEVNSFEDYLVSKGFSLITRGRSLDTLVRS